MAYVALYRKFRPKRFKELVGQEHIVRTLSNQLESGRIAHAYLFAGPRGTGKTSTAKLFARAINCAAPVDGDPCGECDACLAFAADDNMDIIEIDAASNNGVDNIRDIRDKVVFAPAHGKYKVYIIDEVHMLSPGAFNALLKTLEEPPKHAVFILATTEIHKLPATILSRCQRFDFRLIPAETIALHLKNVLNEVGASFDDGAVDLIAKSASGGMRDALSLADVCLSYCGSCVTAEDAANVLGISDRGFTFAFAESLIDSDTALALEKCRELEAEGKDIAVFTLELMEHLRDVLLCKYAPESREIKNLPADTQEKLKAQAKKADVQRILRAIEILSLMERDLKLHSRPEIQLETAAVRICTPQVESDISALEDRIHVLEEKLKNGVTVQVAQATQTAQVSEITQSAQTARSTQAAADSFESKDEKKETTDAQEKKEAPKAVASGGYWTAICNRIKQADQPLYLMVRRFSGDIDGDKFNIYIPESARSKELIITKNASLIENVIKEITGRELKVVTVIGDKPAGSGSSNALMDAALDLFS